MLSSRILIQGTLSDNKEPQCLTRHLRYICWAGGHILSSTKVINIL